MEIRRLLAAFVAVVALLLAPPVLAEHSDSDGSPADDSSGPQLALDLAPKVGVGAAGGQFIAHFDAAPFVFEARLEPWFGLRASTSAFLRFRGGFQFSGAAIDAGPALFVDVPPPTNYSAELFAAPLLRADYSQQTGRGLGMGGGFEAGLMATNGTTRYTLGVKTFWMTSSGTGDVEGPQILPFLAVGGWLP